jgi:acyl carrier protein
MPQPLTSNGISNPSAPNGDDTRHTVVGIVADVLDLGPRDLADDAVLLELGAESLMFVEIVLKLERAYAIRIERSYALPSARTVGDYVALVRAELAQKGHGSLS